MSKFNEEQLEKAVELALSYEDEEEYCNHHYKLRKSQKREKEQNDRRKQKNRRFIEY